MHRANGDSVIFDSFATDVGPTFKHLHFAYAIAVVGKHFGIKKGLIVIDDIARIHDANLAASLMKEITR